MSETISKEARYKLRYYELRQKHADILYAYIDEAKEKAIDLTSRVVSEEILNAVNEVNELKKQTKTREKKFYKTDEYLNALNKLKELKDELKFCTESKKDEVNKNLLKAIAEITTLNVTIKNRLKADGDRIKELEEFINAGLSSLENELGEVKKEVMGFLRIKIAECVKNYNEDLIILSNEFGVEPPKDKELPIDKEVISLDAPIFSLAKSMKEKRDEKTHHDNESKATSDGQTFIPSENPNTIIN